MSKICIVTTRHVSYNPRVVKEADALSNANANVTVVALRNHPHLAELDDAMLRGRLWRLITANSRRSGGGAGESIHWFANALRQRACRQLCRRLSRPWVIECAQGRETPELRRLACSVSADLYIAHHAEALPAAAAAARKHHALLAFDAEDYHSGMDGCRVPSEVWRPNAANLEDAVQTILSWHATQPKTPARQRIEWLENTYLPKCRYITAASDGIALAYQQRYGLTERPTTILNTFPTSSVSIEPPHEGEASRSVRLYWYSQVIGPARGLESAVDALSQLPPNVELHLRGSVRPSFETELRLRAQRAGTDQRLHLHPPCVPDQLIARASQMDIGLALETDDEVNRLICVTNKLFVYTIAGLPVVASDTPAQQALMHTCSKFGTLCRLGDAGSLASAVVSVIDAERRSTDVPGHVRFMLDARWKWETGQRKLLELVGRHVHDSCTKR